MGRINSLNVKKFRPRSPKGPWEAMLGRGRPRLIRFKEMKSKGNIEPLKMIMKCYLESKKLGLMFWCEASLRIQHFRLQTNIWKLMMWNLYGQGFACPLMTLTFSGQRVTSKFTFYQMTSTKFCYRVYIQNTWIFIKWNFLRCVHYLWSNFYSSPNSSYLETLFVCNLQNKIDLEAKMYHNH